jgi:hypothetical protein
MVRDVAFYVVNKHVSKEIHERWYIHDTKVKYLKKSYTLFSHGNPCEIVCP